MFFFPHLWVSKGVRQCAGCGKNLTLSPRCSEEDNGDRGDNHDTSPHHEPHGEE